MRLSLCHLRMCFVASVAVLGMIAPGQAATTLRVVEIPVPDAVISGNVEHYSYDVLVNTTNDLRGVSLKLDFTDPVGVQLFNPNRVLFGTDFGNVRPSTDEINLNPEAEYDTFVDMPVPNALSDVEILGPAKNDVGPRGAPPVFGNDAFSVSWGAFDGASGGSGALTDFRIARVTVNSRDPIGNYSATLVVKSEVTDTNKMGQSEFTIIREDIPLSQFPEPSSLALLTGSALVLLRRRGK